MLKKLFTLSSSSRPAESAPGFISRYISSANRKAAAFLNRKTREWSVARLKIYLSIFCLTAGGYCLYVTGKAFVQTNGPPGLHKSAPAGKARRDSTVIQDRQKSIQFKNLKP